MLAFSQVDGLSGPAALPHLRKLSLQDNARCKAWRAADPRVTNN